MSKGDTLENGLLKLIFQAVPIANLADNAASGPFTSVFVGLHTADPGEAGTQATSEANYTGYTRVTTSRSSSAWSITNSTISNTVAVTFAQCTGLVSTVTYFSVGSAFSGAGILWYSGALTTPLTISNGITPYFAVGDITITED